MVYPTHLKVTLSCLKTDIRPKKDSLHFMLFKIWAFQDFPGFPVVGTLPSNAQDMGSILGQGAKIQPTSGPKIQNIKQKQYCNKFSEDF